MLVEVAATEDFRNAKQFRSPAPLTPGTDWTGRLRVIGLEPDQQIHYRVTLEDVDTAVRSASQTGTFRTAPLPSSASAPRSIRLHWSGDVAGQGWGINDAFDGYVGFAAMADRNPDLFIHSGDTCYADGSLKETVTLSDGTVWRNRVTPAKSKVAETLEEYRGQYAYNLMDDNYLRFNFQVAQLVQWDDHETVNNWYPGEILDDDRYRERRVDVLAERAYQAFHEWQPIDERPAVSRKLPASSAQLRTSRTSFGSLRTCTTRLRTTTARSARSSRTSLRSGSSSPPPPSRRGTRPERDGFHIRSERRIRPRSGQGQCRSGPHSGFPALRRGQHRRRQPGDDGTAADHTRHGAVVDHLAATVVLQDSLPPQPAGLFNL